jgi:hypothetical protein
VEEAVDKLKKTTAVILFVWFITVAILYTLPGYQLVFRSRSRAAGEIPTPPPVPQVVSLPELDLSKDVAKLGEQSKRSALLVDLYKARLDAYETEVAIYQAQADIFNKTAAGDFAGRYKQVTDTLSTTLTTLLAAFLAFAGISATAQVVNNAISMRNNRDPEPIRISPFDRAR